ncbi:MAG: GIY-YIG nuclease family protein [Patescibacteria group bacterium]
MKRNNEDYYVYVYIDPRNFEDFYYGKGKGSRRYAHLKDDSDSEKSQRIQAIQKLGLEPIIRVIAKDLAEREAFLIEKTLIWKLGRTLTNKSSGRFADKFRPHYSLYRDDLPGFDFKNGLYYVNVGQYYSTSIGNRVWEDCSKYGFLAAGGGKQWSDPIRTLNKDDIVVAYLKRHGYVGVGRVVEKAVRASEFKHNGKLLLDIPLKSTGLFRNLGTENCDYLVKIEWMETVDAEKAKWRARSELFTAQRVVVSLRNQPGTIKFIKKEFGVKF